MKRYLLLMALTLTVSSTATADDEVDIDLDAVPSMAQVQEIKDYRCGSYKSIESVQSALEERRQKLAELEDKLDRARAKWAHPYRWARVEKQIVSLKRVIEGGRERRNDLIEELAHKETEYREQFPHFRFPDVDRDYCSVDSYTTRH